MEMMLLADADGEPFPKDIGIFDVDGLGNQMAELIGENKKGILKDMAMQSISPYSPFTVDKPFK